ncbi:MAG: HupE/UreJ family protein [Polyangiaceae bacterium]
MIRWLALLLLVLVATSAEAHPLAPASLQLTEGEGGTIAVTFKQPRIGPRGSRPTPRWPDACVPGPISSTSDEAEARVERLTLRCDALVGERFEVSGLGDLNALLILKRRDGSVDRALLDGTHPSFTVPPREPATRVVGDFLRLGLAHLFGGLDHLLFLLGLLLLAERRRQAIVALTSFTLGHSLTLAAATFGWLRLPPALAESAIALSLVVVAVALVHRRGARHSPLLALGFGLVHGLGFASGLVAAGLPSGRVPLALFGFNLGIELGQLACALAGWALMAWLRKSARLPSRARLQPLAGYAMGCLAAMWLWERATPLL